MTTRQVAISRSAIVKPPNRVGKRFDVKTIAESFKNQANMELLG